MGGGFSNQTIEGMPAGRLAQQIEQIGETMKCSFKPYAYRIRNTEITGKHLSQLAQDRQLDKFCLEDLEVVDPVHRNVLVCSFYRAMDLCPHCYFERWDIGFVCVDCHEVQDHADLVAKEEAHIETIDIGDKSVSADSVNRGVTIGFLVEFTNKYNLWDVPTWKVRRDIIIPATFERRCRYCELESMQASGVVGKAETFVSHTWGGKWGDLVAAVSDHADPNRIVWVDIFAIRQWPARRPDLDFSTTIKLCTSFLLVCSSLPELADMDNSKMFSRDIKNLLPPHVRRQIAFFRVWCLVEVYAAATDPNVCKALVMKGGSYQLYPELRFKANQSMFENLYFIIDVDQAEATVESDRERILSSISVSDVGLEGLNSVIRGVVSGATVATKYPLVQTAVLGDKHAVDAVLAEPEVYWIPVASSGYTDLMAKLFATGDKEKLIKFRDTDFSNTALHWAAEGGHLSAMQFLLDNGADAMAQADNQSSPMMVAAMGGHEKAVQVLIEHGAEVNQRDDQGLDAMIGATMSGHVHCMKLLLSQGVDISYSFASGDERIGYLQIACSGPHFDAIKFLVDNGCTTNKKLSLEIIDEHGREDISAYIRENCKG